MLNQKSIAEVEKAKFSSQFRRPLYESYSFARVPATVQKLLTGESEHPLPVDTVGGQWNKYDVVILFLIDGFGWQFFNQYSQQYPFLKRIVDQGTASKITSQFPSTTAAHVTTINTGLEVGQTGVYEWFYYEPLVDRMITPLLYSYAGDHLPGSLSKSGVKPDQLYPNRTVYQKLQEKNVRSFVMQQEGISHSPYSGVMFNGAKNVPYRYLRDGLSNLIDVCKEPHSGPTYLYFYFGDIDAMGHRHGIDSTQFSDAVAYCWQMFEEHFWQRIGECNNKIGCALIADHGMVPVDPKKTVYLNQAFPNITDHFVQNKEGRPLVPAGSCRDFFLHVKPESFDQVLTDLRQQFKGMAEVYPTEHLIKEGLFGSRPPSARFLEKVGNVVILPYLGESIWWYEKHRFEQHFYGAHGGLTPQEMESIFLFIDNA